MKYQVHFSFNSRTTDMTDATLGTSGLQLRTRTGAGGTTTLDLSFFDRSPWLHGQQVHELLLQYMCMKYRTLIP